MAQDPGSFPCVIYCHGNSGSRRDATEAVMLLIPQRVSVFCFDFSGSGLSGGDWVTLGAQEVLDLEVAVEYLRQIPQISTIALWGRSMGAVTSLLYSRRDPSIAGMVLDSPFSKLTDLALELVDEQQVPVPKALVKVALALMRRSVRKKAGFDISTIAPIDIVDESFVPALFGHADGDDFIKKSHSEKLLDQYAGDKNLISFPGDHNSVRPQFFYSSVSIFFHNVLGIQGETPIEVQADLPVVNEDPRRGLIPLEGLENGGSDLESALMLTQTTHHRADGDWDTLLPGSQIEEDQMLQAALRASFFDTNDEDSGSKKQQDQSTSEAVVSEDRNQELLNMESSREDQLQPFDESC